MDEADYKAILGMVSESPRRINRVVTDAISDVLLVTERSGLEILSREGVPAESVHMVGKLMIDSLRNYLPRALQSDVAARLRIDGGRFGSGDPASSRECR